MSNTILNELITLFPNVSEEFLSGICDAYKDEEIPIEDLIDVILSYEFKPPRETVGELSKDSSNSGTIVIKSEVLECNNDNDISPSVVQPIENEVQKSAPSANCNVPLNRVEPLMETQICVKHPIASDNSISKEVFDEPVCENYEASCPLSNNSELKVELLSDFESEVSTNPLVEKQCIEVTKLDNEISYPNCSLNHCQTSDDNDDDSSPECSIKYLMAERNVLERFNITTDFYAERPEEDGGLPQDDGKLTTDSSILRISNQKIVCQILGAIPKPKCRSRKRSINSTMLQNGNCRCINHSSNKRATLRSSKVKNEEERLRRRLINQSKRFHERDGNNTNSILYSSQFLNIDRKYSLLSNIFTDADPTYLLGQCDFLTDQEKILDFISRNLELRDYPRVETKREEPKLMDGFHCTIPHFLEVIPDPLDEFSSANYVRDGYEENAEIYLKARYNELNSNDIKERLRASMYNLTAVCTQLEDEGKVPTPRVLEYTPLHHPASVFFHQEVWFIEHRKQVQEYLDSALEAIRVEEEMNRPPSPPEEFFECQICADDRVEYTNLGTCDGKTGHLFCLDCIKRSVEIKMGEGGTTFPCLVNCGSFIPLRTVEELVSGHEFHKLMGRIQEEQIRKANIAGVECCPFCPYAYGPGEEALFTCLNPECMKLSCRVCRKEDHSPEICEMLRNEDEETARHMIEDQMAEALMRTCYNCSKKFVKSDGCNKMECTCGAKMCYVCRQPVQDYSHFNGQGGDNTDRCPLFSEFNELHDRPVQETAQQVFNQLAANNPQLNLDPAKLIPK